MPNKNKTKSTILERFRVLEKSGAGSADFYDIIEFFGCEDTNSLCVDSEKIVNECIDFYLYFHQYYNQIPTISMLDSAFPGGPHIFQVAEKILSLAPTAPVPTPVLTPVQEERMDAVVEYIIVKKADRDIVVSFDGVPHRLYYPANLNPHEQYEAITAIAELVTGMFDKNTQSIMIFRYSSSVEGKDIVNGFVGIGGTLEIIPADELKAAHETDEAGNPYPDPTAIFETANVNFD